MRMGAAWMRWWVEVRASWRAMVVVALLLGRMARATRPFEVVANGAAAQHRQLHVGSRVNVYSYSARQVLHAGASGFGAVPAPRGQRFVVRVVGIVRQPTDISVVPVRQDVTYAGSGGVYFTPAFLRRYADALGFPFDELPGQEIIRVRL